MLQEDSEQGKSDESAQTTCKLSCD